MLEYNTLLLDDNGNLLTARQALQVVDFGSKGDLATSLTTTKKALLDLDMEQEDFVQPANLPALSSKEARQQRRQYNRNHHRGELYTLDFRARKASKRLRNRKLALSA